MFLKGSKLKPALELKRFFNCLKKPLNPLKGTLNLSLAPFGGLGAFFKATLELSFPSKHLIYLTGQIQVFKNMIQTRN